MSQSKIVCPVALPIYFYLVCVETNGWFFYLTHYVRIHLARTSTHNFCQALCSLPVVVQEYRRVFRFESYNSKCGYIFICGFHKHRSADFFNARHPFDYQTIYLINTSTSNSTSDSVDKLIHHIMEFILFMTPASHC